MSAYFVTGSDFWAILVHLAVALVAGALIGIERTYHGRPAGFRTHALVCLASSLLMQATLYQSHWLPDELADVVRSDPARMAQGIMTGIGFLGAGVIFKEGVTVRGLTTAASIWVTAAIGVLFGVGFYVPAIIATGLTLLTLSILRWVEDRMPVHHYSHHAIVFRRDEVMPELEVRQLLASMGFHVVAMSYRVSENGEYFEYRTVIRTDDPRNNGRLAGSLSENAQVHSFRIAPTED